MRNFRTLSQAKKDRDVLQDYIELIEQYQPESIEQYVVLEYALQGGILKVASNLNQRGLSFKGEEFSPDIVTQVLTSPPKQGDHLHREIRRLYRKRTRHIRRKPTRM